MRFGASLFFVVGEREGLQGQGQGAIYVVDVLVVVDLLDPPRHP